MKGVDLRCLTNKKMVTVLFTQQNSIYKKLKADVWDITRDATTWPGGEPIIAHPPCRGWGNYAHKAKVREGEKELAIWAIKQIQKYGGALEHPSSSKLWKELDLPKGKKVDQYGGWTLNIDQKWFGHRANKRTNIYIVGTTPGQIPNMPITLEKAKTTVENLSRNEREKTPEALAKWLIELIIIIKNKKEQFV